LNETVRCAEPGLAFSTGRGWVMWREAPIAPAKDGSGTRLTDTPRRTEEETLTSPQSLALLARHRGLT